jgi:hypothetical protein
MAVTISLYNHTAKRFADGSNAVGDTYKVALYTAATFDATNTTLAGITKTEHSNGNGYTTGGATLASVAVNQSGNDAAFDAADVTWSASGGSISASYAIVYNDTDANDPPVCFIDFGGAATAGDATDFKLIWNASGIVTFTVS